jgi:hypothetical protein
MIPDPLTWGHVLMAAAFLAVLATLWYGLSWWRHRGTGRGTPLYARARDARRATIYGAVAAILFAIIGCLTPLCTLPIA